VSARLRRSMRWALTAGVLLSACTIKQRTDRARATSGEPPVSEFIKPWGDDGPPVGVKSGDLVWIWGMTGSLPGTLPPRLVEGGVGPETRQALENISDILKSAGAALADVAQCSAFVADTADVAAMTKVYEEYFGTPPARSAVPIGGLTSPARVELECTAVLPSGAQR
jgi:2-iminobutanoate/2-iminopropanoate deaminase